MIEFIYLLHNSGVLIDKHRILKNDSLYIIEVLVVIQFSF